MEKWVGSVPRRCFSAQFNSVKKRSLWKTTVISMSKKLQQEDHDITWFWNATEMRDARQSPPRLKDWEMKKLTAKHFNCYLQVFWMGLLLIIDLFSLILWQSSDLSMSLIHWYFIKLCNRHLYLTYRKDTGQEFTVT